MQHDEQELAERTEDIRRLLLTMRWDIEHNQFNESKRAYYMRLEQEFADLNRQLETIRGLGNGTNQNSTREESHTSAYREA